MIKAAFQALKKQKEYQRLLAAGLRPPEAYKIIFGRGAKPERLEPVDLWKKRDSKKIAVGLLAYPYTVFDPYISAGIYEKLTKLGVGVITFEQVPLVEMQRFSKVLPQNFFWYYSNQVCWAGLYLLENKKFVDGIIHVSAFGCGPDAMVGKTLELEAKAAGMPLLSLTIDEHTGEGGVQTRLEAFIDMLWTQQAKVKTG